MKTYNVRKLIFNATLDQWHAIDKMDLTRVKASDFDAVGKPGFNTALVNEHEMEFVKELYPNYKPNP